MATAGTDKRGAASPDASLIGDDGISPTSDAGLTYPWGKRAPSSGTVIRVAPSLRWARLPMPGSLGHINSWLIDDADDAGPGYCPVDTGLMLTMCSDAWKALFAGDLAGERITRVLCTHLHPDHVGLAGWLAKKSGTAIWMTRSEWQQARFMLTDVRDAPPPEVAAFQRASGWPEEAVAAAAAQGWSRIGQVVFPLPYSYRRMVDGEVIRFGATDWRVVVGSGHSPEHACLLDEVNGVLIAGDQVLPKISSNVSLGPSEPDADPLGEWLASIDKLFTLPDDLLVCPAHGEPFRGLHIRLAALRDQHHSRLDALALALRDTPMRVIDSFGYLFSRTIGPEQIGLASGEAMAHLRRLERDGRALRETRDGVWWWVGAS